MIQRSRPPDQPLIELPVWLRDSCEWFKLLSSSSRDRVLSDCYERSYQTREIIARRGESAHLWVGVIEGLVKVSAPTSGGHSVMFTAVPSGSWIGEGSVIKREPRRYDLTAFRPTRAAHVPRSTFMWLLETSIEFNRFIIDHLNERTGQFISMMEVNRLRDPAARVAGAICMLFNPVLYPRASSLIKISQEEIGELAGLSRPTTNQAVNGLKRLQLISVDYGGILVLDLDQLRKFVHASSARDEVPADGA